MAKGRLYPPMNLFRKFWLAAKVKAILGGDMESVSKLLGWLFKTKFVAGHRRQISVCLTAATAVLAFTSGPIGAIIPALANPAIQKVMLTAAAYVGLVGEAFKNDPK